MSKGRLFILSGPSGSGKDCIMKGVFERLPEIRFSISSITRAMRVGEVEGEKYHFISREEFEDLLSKDGFLEHNCYVGNYYGTPKAPVEQAIEDGADMMVEIDVNGAEQIRNKVADAVSIFIMPPSVEALRERLKGRGTEDEAKVQRRMEEALVEIARAKEYDFVVVNEDGQLEKAVEDVVKIIEADRLRVDRAELV